MLNQRFSCHILKLCKFQSYDQTFALFYFNWYRVGGRNFAVTVENTFCRSPKLMNWFQNTHSMIHKVSNQLSKTQRSFKMSNECWKKKYQFKLSKSQQRKTQFQRSKLLHNVIINHFHVVKPMFVAISSFCNYRRMSFSIEMDPFLERFFHSCPSFNTNLCFAVKNNLWWLTKYSNFQIVLNIAV